MEFKWSVDITLVEDWLQELDQDSHQQVLAAIGLLSTYGPNLGRPLVDTITHSQYKNMKELRPGSAGRTEIRILFAFDPLRRAILLIAGDKSGNWGRWYRKNIPKAELRFQQHLKELEGK